MKPLAGRLATLLTVAAVLAPLSLAAQANGLPIVNSGIRTGLSVAADIGAPNDDAGGGTAYGGEARFGLGIIGVSGSVARHVPENDLLDSRTSFGGAVTAQLFGGPLVPFRVLLQGGVATWEANTATATDVRHTRFPVSLGLAATIPIPVLAVKPWLAPRIEAQRASGNTETDFGISGGIELAFLSGLTIRTAYDRLFVERDGFSSRPSVWTVGLGWTL